MVKDGDKEWVNDKKRELKKNSYKKRTKDIYKHWEKNRIERGSKTAVTLWEKDRDTSILKASVFDFVQKSIIGSDWRTCNRLAPFSILFTLFQSVVDPLSDRGSVTFLTVSDLRMRNNLSESWIRIRNTNTPSLDFIPSRIRPFRLNILQLMCFATYKLFYEYFRNDMKETIGHPSWPRMSLLSSSPLTTLTLRSINLLFVKNHSVCMIRTISTHNNKYRYWFDLTRSRFMIRIRIKHSGSTNTEVCLKSV